MSPWTVLIGTLEIKPPEPKPRGNPHINEMQAKKKETSYRLVRNALKKLGGAATARQLADVTKRSYPYVCNVCSNMMLDDELVTFMVIDGKARRKYWKLAT
jgi:hypothetical protein